MVQANGVTVLKLVSSSLKKRPDKSLPEWICSLLQAKDLPSNIRLGWKGMISSNALAYLIIMKKHSSLTLTTISTLGYTTLSLFIIKA